MTRGRVFALTGLAMIAVVFMNPGSRWIGLNEVGTVFGRWDFPQMDGPWSNASMPRLNAEPWPVSRPADSYANSIQRLRAWCEQRGGKEAMALLAREASYELLLVPNLSKVQRKEAQARVQVNRETLQFASGEGARLDPKNAFFWFCRAVAAEANGDIRGVEANLARAAVCDTYDDYAFWEGQQRANTIESKRGYRGEIVRLWASAMVSLPHLTSFSELSERISTRPDLATRLNVLRTAALMSDKSGQELDLLVARSLARQVIEVKNPRVRAQSISGPDPSLERARALAKELNQPWIGTTAERIYGRVWPYNFGAGDPFTEMSDRERISRMAGASMLVGAITLLAVLVLGLLSRRFGIGTSGAVPHLAAAASWLYVLSVLPGGEQKPDSLIILTLLHLFLCLQYGSDRVARFGGLLWSVLAMSGLALVPGMVKEPLIYLSIPLTIYLCLQSRERRVKFAALAGLGIAGASLLTASLAEEAIVPAIAYALAHWLQKSSAFKSGWIGTSLLLLGVTAAGLGFVHFASGIHGGLVEAILWTLVAAFFLTLLLRPVEAPARVGFVMLILAFCYLANVGQQMRFNSEVKKYAEEFARSGERMRQERDKGS